MAEHLCNLLRETRRIAEAEGVEIVLVDDSASEIRTENNAQVSLQAQVLQQISTRRVLFAKNTIDITDQVIVRMNNAVGLTLPSPPSRWIPT